MKITSLHIRNFMQVEVADIERMDLWGLTLIQGENRDDPSAVSNGAGKSTIADAISWSLYGKTARGTSGDEVIRKEAKKNCSVSLTFTDAGEHYEVIRSRKDKTHGSSLKLFRVASDGATQDMTLGTAALTQVAIDRLVGATHEVFSTGVYAGQEAMPDLPSMTDKSLKEIIEKAAGVDRLIGAYTRARDKANLAKKANETAEAELEKKRVVLRERQTQLDAAEARVKEWEVDKITRLDQADTVAKAERAKRSGVLFAADNELPAKIYNLKAAIQKLADDAMPARLRYKAAQTDVTRLTSVLESRKTSQASAEKQIGNMTTQFNMLMDQARELSAANKALTLRVVPEPKPVVKEDVSSRLGKPCKTCGKPVTAEDLVEVEAAAQAAYEAAVVNAKQTHIDQTELAKIELAKHQSDGALKLDSLKARIRTLGEQIEAAKAGLPEFVRVVEEAAQEMAAAKVACEEAALKLDSSEESNRLTVELGLAQRALETQQAAILAADRAVETAEANYKRISFEKNPHRAAVDAVDVIGAADAVVKAEVTQNETFIWHGRCRDAALVFSPAGVRAHILDTVTPFLNERTGHYLGVLSDGNIIAEWSTIGYTKTDELREEFNIRVENLNGAATFAGMSGGEKRKVRLSTAMAVQDLIATRATKPINLFIADEIDDALDEAALERLMALLEEKAKARGTVLLISHADLNAWVRDTVTVVKEGGVSRIEAKV